MFGTLFAYNIIEINITYNVLVLIAIKQLIFRLIKGGYKNTIFIKDASTWKESLE